MVAVIKTGSSIRRIFNYNEQKVKEGNAQCIMASNYPKDVELLTLSNKLNRLLNQAALNENVTRNSVHISLNFDPSENLSVAQLREIAEAYMLKIGFDKQPYLVYQHHDSGHPHIHIVSIKVKADGSRIDTQNIGRNQSENARKEIEHSFGLVKAANKKRRQAYELKPVNVQKVQYGKSETKRAITNVLDAVLNIYKYASVPELNAILGQYNILADRGSEESRVYQNNGLVYRILDGDGNKVGVPVKASDLYNKPTLKYLQAKFQQNEAARQPYKVRVRNAIDLALIKNPNHSIQSLAKSLEKEGVIAVLRRNDEGITYGITYVDHSTKSVFNGSDLGKQYSAKGIQERCKVVENSQPNETTKQQAVLQQKGQNSDTKNEQEFFAVQARQSNIPKPLDDSLQPSQSYNYLPHQLKKSRKKRRKRISNNF
ncbi:MAG: relaxase/mobilization nuclease domain-containing protein [Chitinophagaceae bacterium]